MMHRFLLTISLKAVSKLRRCGFQPQVGVEILRQDTAATFSKPVLKTLLVFVATLMTCTGVKADEHSDALSDYLTDDVVAVAYLDLSSIDPDAMFKLLDQLGFVANEERADFASFSAQVESELTGLTRAGIRHVYALLRTSDVNTGGPVWVIPVANDKLDIAQQSLQNVLKKLPPIQNALQSVETRNNTIVAGATESHVNQVLARPKLDRDLSAAWQALGNGSAGLIVFGGSDSRRVVREMFPALPAPFESITGDFVADELKWGGIELVFPPKLNLKVEVEAASPAASIVVSNAIRNGIVKLGAWPQIQSILPETDRDTILNSLQPIVTETRTIVSFDPVTDDLERLAKVLRPAVRQTRDAATLQAEMNHVRQLAHAMHNYHDTFRHLPNPDGRSEKHPAGLSWRVHVLPFLGETELWKQFKLDEPWDSQHNLPLATQMPSVYQSSWASSQVTNKQGKTIYQVPYAREALFAPGAADPSLMEVTDGTSNTIMIVTTLPDSAAIWTKPDDWEVDLNDPAKGIMNGKRAAAVAAFADASVHVIPATIAPETLRALITKAGGEVIQDRF